MYDWAVVGAGPAGIAAVGTLIDHGIAPDKIIWLDPRFSVGDFGTLWRNVPSNTKVELFLKFLYASKAFAYADCPHDFALHHLDPESTCYLRFMVEPLQWITDHLRNTVHTQAGLVERLFLNQRAWHLNFKDQTLQARNVILAVGAEAKNSASPGLTIIPLHDAMDSEGVKRHIHPDDTIAVYGSSHSAMLALRNLLEHQAKQVINFYRSPLRYAVYLDDWILFDDTGLKGSTAAWARASIDGDMPKNLLRFYANPENIERYLPQCNKVVYAIGFERRTLPVVEAMGHLGYIEQCGIIAPGLFGCGIAFPEAKYNPFGLLEYRVGLWKFMEYLQRIMPVWLKYPV